MMGLGKKLSFRRRLPSKQRPSEPTTKRNLPPSQLRVGMFGGPYHPAKAVNSARSGKAVHNRNGTSDPSDHRPNQPPQVIYLPAITFTKCAPYCTFAPNHRRHDEEEDACSGTHSGTARRSFENTAQGPSMPQASLSPSSSLPPPPSYEECVVSSSSPSSPSLPPQPPQPPPPPSYEECEELGLFTRQHHAACPPEDTTYKRDNAPGYMSCRHSLSM